MNKHFSKMYADDVNGISETLNITKINVLSDG